MNGIKLICKAIDTFTEWTGRVVSFLSLGTMAVILYEVLMRRIFNNPQIWTMDIICMSFGCYVILISAFGFLRKSFVAVDVLYARVPELPRHFLHIFTYLVFFVPFTYSLIPFGWNFFMKAYTSHELAYSTWQPVTWPLKFCLFLGLLLLAVQGMSEILKHVDWIVDYFRRGRKGRAANIEEKGGM